MAKVKGSRREKAEQTRRAIARAANEEFVEHGYQGATIASIAKRAGVAVQTVYYVFNTKAALISAAIDQLVMGDEEPTIPQDTDWWRAMVAEPDPAKALGHFIRGAAALFESASALSEILRGAALNDDDLRRTYEFHERMRAQGFREVINVIAGKGRLREDLTVDTATDALLVVFGDSTYYQLRWERGWTQEQVVHWYVTTLPGMLLRGDR